MTTEKITEQSILSQETQGKYFGLNPVATRVWELLASPMSYQGVLQRLLTTYKIDPVRCDTELRSFLTTMIENGLVRLTSYPARG